MTTARTTSSLRVLHLSSEKSWRGGEQQMAYLIEESLKAGLSCHVIARSDSAMGAWAQERQIPCTTTRFGGVTDLGSARLLKRYVNEHNIDLIHVHSGKGHDMLALAFLMGLRTTCVLSRRVDFPVKSNPWARWKYNLPIIKRVVCVSQAICDMVRPALKVPEHAVTVYSGIDLARFEDVRPSVELRSNYAIPTEALLIGNVSALAPHKDYPTFIRTAKRCLDQGLNAYFLIIGEGSERGLIEAEVKKLGIQNRVILTGFRQDVPEVLHALDLFLISSKTEGLGTTVLDAFACQLPVIATAGGGLVESVIHEQTGLLCPVGDDKALSEAIIRLNQDERLRAQLIAGATQHLKQFSKEEMAQRSIAIYAELVLG